MTGFMPAHSTQEGTFSLSLSLLLISAISWLDPHCPVAAIFGGRARPLTLTLQFWNAAKQTYWAVLCMFLTSPRHIFSLPLPVSGDQNNMGVVAQALTLAGGSRPLLVACGTISMEFFLCLLRVILSSRM